MHRARISLVCKLEHGEYSAVEARNVNFWWPNGQQALKDVNLKVSPGELAMIVGHNGCGKSTLLRILRGLVFPASGNVHIEKPCAFVHQNPNIQIVYPTIGADVALSVPREPDTTARDVRAAVLKALDSVGLHPPEKFLRLSSHRLSGGQRQRVVVAAALAMEPRSILFDEATASMDPMNKMDLTSRVRRLVTNRKIAAIW